MCKWPILGTEDSRILFGGTWIPDSSHQWDSGFLELYSGSQSLEFWIPQTKISQILEAGFNINKYQ